MALVAVTTDADTRGFEVEVEALSGGGWVTVELGFLGFGPGEPTRVYVDGRMHWAQRRFGNVMMVPG